jgi:hypothetical protein
VALCGGMAICLASFCGAMFRCSAIGFPFFRNAPIRVTVMMSRHMI